MEFKQSTYSTPSYAIALVVCHYKYELSCITSRPTMNYIVDVEYKYSIVYKYIVYIELYVEALHIICTIRLIL